MTIKMMAKDWAWHNSTYTMQLIYWQMAFPQRNKLEPDQQNKIKEPQYKTLIYFQQSFTLNQFECLTFQIS